MKKHLFFIPLLFFYIHASSQVEVDKTIQLTGSDGNRAVTNLELPISGTDAANKDYVDNAVSASGGSGLPVMITDESATTMNFGDALRYCKNLTDGGYSDWRLPDFSTLTDALSIGGITVANNSSTNYIWFKLMPYGSTTAMLGSMRVSDGEIDGVSINALTAVYRVRCVR